MAHAASHLALSFAAEPGALISLKQAGSAALSMVVSASSIMPAAARRMHVDMAYSTTMEVVAASRSCTRRWSEPREPQEPW